MEISLDNMQVSFMTAGIKTASDSVSLTAAETEIKSRSEAMDKFQEEYRQLKAFVKDYRDTLNNDLAKIDLIINAIMKMTENREIILKMVLDYQIQL